MSSIKSVNVASWGLAIVALFLLIMGIEEICCSIDALEGFALGAGNFAIVVGVIVGIVALYSFWNGDKTYGVLFAWLFIVFITIPFVSKVGINLGLRESGDLEGLTECLLTFGSHLMIVGIVLAVFTAILGAWAFVKNKADKFLGIFLFALAAYILFIAIGDGMWKLDLNGLVGSPTIIIVTCDSEIASQILCIVGGIAAIIAAGVGMYIGFIREKFMGKPLVESSEAKGMESYDVTEIGLFITAFYLVLVGIMLILSMNLGELKIDTGNASVDMNSFINAYWLPPVIFAVPGIFTSLIFMLFSYWNGNKNGATGFFVAALAFTIMVVMLIGLEPVGAYLNALAEVETGSAFNESFVNKSILIPYIVFALFFGMIAAWMGTKTNFNKLYTASVALIALAFLTLAFTVLCSWDNRELFRVVEIIAGAFILLSGIILTYVGIAKTGMAKLPLP